jgi:putative phosphoesterase
MKVLVISDSHGNIANLKHVMGFGKKIGVKAVIHCGDWDSVEVADCVLSHKIPLYSVIGNSDIDASLVSKLKSQSSKFGEQFLGVELGGRKIGITHNPSDNKKYFAGEKLDIIFNGHLHSKSVSEKDGAWVVRPGAIIKGSDFAVYDTDANKVEFIEDE